MYTIILIIIGALNLLSISSHTTMDSKNTTTADNAATQPSSPRIRRSGRDRKKTPLVASFKDSIVGYVDTVSPLILSQKYVLYLMYV